MCADGKDSNHHSIIHDVRFFCRQQFPVPFFAVFVSVQQFPYVSRNPSLANASLAPMLPLRTPVKPRRWGIVTVQPRRRRTKVVSFGGLLLSGIIWPVSVQ
jgi:hypothetical protein